MKRKETGKEMVGEDCVRKIKKGGKSKEWDRDEKESMKGKLRLKGRE